MIQWTVRMDRRVVDHRALQDTLTTYHMGIEHLHVEVFDAHFIETLPDAGTFRDFIPVAILSHPSEAALEYVAEALLEDFGWRVDFLPYRWQPEPNP